jgi:transcription elongation factor Elf1
MGLHAAEMRYVICPSCGDAVVAGLPSGRDSKRTVACVHCEQKLETDGTEILEGMITFDDASRRWKVPSAQ